MANDDDVIGFLSRGGKWATVQELEAEFGDQLDTPIPQLLEELHEIDWLNVTRNDDGEIVTSQLSEFATDLYALPEDADVGRVIGVYKKHDKEIPEDLKDEFWNEFQANKAQADAINGENDG